MKYIKAYEVKREPQIGDYIIGKDIFNEYNDFISTNIGEIVNVEIEENIPDEPEMSMLYTVKYNNVPDELTDSFFSFEDDDDDLDDITLLRKNIIHFSPNKEKMIKILMRDKYNL